MVLSINKWLSKDSLEASRKSKMWASGKRTDAISKDDLDDLQWWRINIIDIMNNLRPNSISGKVMEVGAGQGIASAYLTSFNSVETVYAIDYSEEACKLTLKTVSYFDKAIPSKLKIVHGSYDDIKDSDFDLIVAFGAIHNSPDFSVTFKSLYDKLAANGRLVVSDMSLSFIATTKDEQWATNRIVPASIKKYGEELRYIDTNDYFRSIYDYLFYAKKAGFRVYPVIWNVKSKNKLTNLDQDLLGLFPNSFYPTHTRGRFDPILLICEKDTNINKNCLPISSSPKHNFIMKVINIFIRFGFKKGKLMIIEKIKKKIKNTLNF